jgi:hypothetical protein
MNFIIATNLNRKSGGAQGGTCCFFPFRGFSHTLGNALDRAWWRDPRFSQSNLQLQPHDWPRRCVQSHDLETGAGEG